MFLRTLAAQARRRRNEAAARVLEAFELIAAAARATVDAYRPVPMAAVRVMGVLEAAEMQAFGRAFQAPTEREREAAIGEANLMAAVLEAARGVL